MKMKRQVGYTFIALGVLKAAFLFYERFTGHSVPLVEDASYALLVLMGVALMFTDIQKPLTGYINWMYQNVELGMIDALNYALVRLVVSSTGVLRKTHTGVLRHNLIAVQAGGFILLLVFLFLGGYL
jgi:hypothetical protein